ncbi:MAG: hypothetical protein JWM56_519 [Candidatus Peribacteria bacterium]|nr:hypothetical protein [Candidatus Peribacteria bacterium]
MHLKELAPRMTDEERSATLEKMQKIDAELVANIQSTANLSKEADEIMHTFEANVLRPMAKDAEAAERSSENSAADQLFN